MDAGEDACATVFLRMQARCLRYGLEVDMEFNFEYAHPAGRVRARVTANGVAAIALPAQGEKIGAVAAVVSSPVAERLAKALDNYFAGRREGFRHLPLDIETGTPFQRRVWLAARDIPWGSTSTYGELARVVGCGSARAVGQALGANPVPIIVPCHRILAPNGGLGGFSCGLDWKRRLLGIEKIEVRG
jgi:methylated-DNA-[protein]-cysteine S-methyltransferase